MSEQTWTTEVPTKPGPYWLDYPNEMIEIVWIRLHRDTRRFFYVSAGHAEFIDSGHERARWCRIPQPSDPKQ